MAAAPRVVLALASWLWACSPALAAEVAVHVVRDGDSLAIEASADFEAALPLAWQVITDYDRLHEFIPNLRLSRVIERGRDGITVEQKGEARFLVFSYPIEVRLVISESPPGKVVARAVAGNFREMTGVYVLEALEGRVRLRYSGRMTPDFAVPPLIGTWLLRRHVHETFAAMVDEIVRRHRNP